MKRELGRNARSIPTALRFDLMVLGSVAVRLTEAGDLRGTHECFPVLKT